MTAVCCRVGLLVVTVVSPLDGVENLVDINKLFAWTSRFELAQNI
jgi:hypothetical protein